MRAFRFADFNAIARPLVGSLAIVLVFALLAFNVQPTVTADSSQDAPDSPQATFPADAPSLGAVPDGPGAAGTCGADRNVTFTVAGMVAPLSNVEVSLTMTHTWVGDVEASLVSPAGVATHLLFSRTGATTAASFGDSSDLAGPYHFNDLLGPVHWWTAATTAGAAAPVAAGDYRTVAAGPSAANPALTTMTTTFAGLTTGQANGTWTLRMRDCGGGDTGTVSAATLTLVGGSAVVPQHIVDYDGDGKTDPSVVRETGGFGAGQTTWFNQNSLGGTTATPWGIATDFFVPEDYDGDGKTDIAVWRAGAPFNSYFYILQSTTGTLRTDQFGQSGDDPTVVGDYDGDGKADPSVYRTGVASGDHSFWYYRGSTGPNSGLIIGTEWGQNSDFPAPGDYDGDGKFDFAVQRSAGDGQAIFFIKQTTAGVTSIRFGIPTDFIVPGDYDGDGKYDLAVTRGGSGELFWYIRRSSDGVTTQTQFGLPGDYTTPGDWDGDGKTDIAVWRANVDPALNFFYIRRSSTGTDTAVEWGQNDDFPVANYSTH